jgi:hypothetical protein
MVRLSTGTVRCQCINVGVQIVILMQIWHGDDGSFPLRWHPWFLDCTSKPISCQLWLSPKGIRSLFQASRRTWHVRTQFCSLSRQGRHLATIGRVFTLSFRMLWTDPYEIPNMLPTSWIVIFLFLRISSCAWFIFSFVFRHWTCQTSASSVEATLLQILESYQKCIFFILSTVQHFKSFHRICFS